MLFPAVVVTKDNIDATVVADGFQTKAGCDGAIDNTLERGHLVRAQAIALSLAFSQLGKHATDAIPRATRTFASLRRRNCRRLLKDQP